MTCNTGAIASVQDLTGNLTCACFPPYQPILQNGEPLVNAQGPLCQNETVICPAGTVHVGNDANGVPVCNDITSTATQTCPGDSFSSTDPFCVHSCVNGWISNIDRNCQSFFDITEVDCPSGCGHNPWTILIGAIVGFVIGLIFLLIAVAINDQFWSVVVYCAVVGMAIAAGAVAGYFAGNEWDWFLIDQQRGYVPEIVCNYTVTCGSPAGGTCGSASTNCASSSYGNGVSTSIPQTMSTAVNTTISNSPGGSPANPTGAFPTQITLNNQQYIYNNTGTSTITNANQVNNITLNGQPYGSGSNCSTSGSQSSTLPSVVNISGANYYNASGTGTDLGATISVGIPNIGTSTYVKGCSGQ